MTTNRRKRHLKIFELISSRPMHTQEELADALTALGWEVTQSSVSRVRRGEIPDEQRVAEGVLTIETAGEALVVLHTPPGEANHVAVALDRLGWPR